MKKNMKSICLMAIGALAILLSIVCFAKDDGVREGNEYYGGDAYTGIQHAAAHTANNVQKLADIERFGFGSILLIAGCTLLVMGMPEKKEELNAENQAASVETGSEQTDAKVTEEPADSPMPVADRLEPASPEEPKQDN